jgi:hypothetical protein
MASAELTSPELSDAGGGPLFSRAIQLHPAGSRAARAGTTGASAFAVFWPPRSVVVRLGEAFLAHLRHSPRPCVSSADARGSSFPPLPARRTPGYLELGLRQQAAGARLLPSKRTTALQLTNPERLAPGASLFRPWPSSSLRGGPGKPMPRAGHGPRATGAARGVLALPSERQRLAAFHVPGSGTKRKDRRCPCTVGRSERLHPAASETPPGFLLQSRNALSSFYYWQPTGVFSWTFCRMQTVSRNVALMMLRST